MTTNWSEEKQEALTEAKRETGKPLCAIPESLVSMSTPQIDQPKFNLVKAEALSTTGITKWKMLFIGGGVMLAALAGVVIFFYLNVASIGVPAFAVTVAGVVAAVGLSHYLVWGRVFARRVVREKQ